MYPEPVFWSSLSTASAVRIQGLADCPSSISLFEDVASASNGPLLLNYLVKAAHMNNVIG